MKHFHRSIAQAAVVLLAALVVSCQPSTQNSAPAPRAAALSTAASEKVFVIFEGPWAFVADPKDPSMVLALAPKTKSHRDLNVAASNNTSLAAGVYDLFVPAHGAPTAGSFDASFVQAKIDAKNLQKALDSKGGRYVIRLPKPEVYVAAARQRARVGATYPPDAATEQNYVVQVSLRYTVASLSGFSLAGTPDTGVFNPFLLQVDTPAIHFVIEPSVAGAPTDLCSTHSRESFRDLVRFLSLTLYVDFPDDTGDCHKSDPQVGSTKTELMTPGTFAAGMQPYVGSLAQINLAPLECGLLTALYLFHGGTSTCKAPILFLTVS